jgi:hypothetical protein
LKNFTEGYPPWPLAVVFLSAFFATLSRRLHREQPAILEVIVLLKREETEQPVLLLWAVHAILVGAGYWLIHLH